MTTRPRPTPPLVPALSAVAALAVALSGCGLRSVDDVPVPETWEYSYPDDSSASIRLEPGGVGVLTNVPPGFFTDCGSADDGEDVAAWSGVDPPGAEGWTGDITWIETGAGRVEVDGGPSGAGIVWSDASGFGGDITWGAVDIEICDAATGDRSTMRFFSFPG